jgi:type II secretory pathway component PulK
MVLMAVAVLATLLADLTFNTQVNKLRVYNRQDQLQAKYNAMAALNFGMVRLKLYKEARNYLEKNPKIKDFAKPEFIDMLWSMPFIFPLPMGDRVDIVTKSMINDFQKNSLLQGELRLIIENSSNLININLLRVARSTKEASEQEDADKEKAQEEQKSKTSSGGEGDLIANIEERLTELLDNAVQSNLKTNEDFRAQFSNLDSKLLIKELKYFISDPKSYDEPERAEMEARYRAKDMSPKFALLSSLSEFHLMDGWEDDIVDLIKNEITVHGVIVIDLNRITQNTLKLLVPMISLEQAQKFFTFRDDPEDPHYFNDLGDFKQYIVNKEAIISDSEFDSRMEKFQKAGITFGTQGSLFKILATGKSGRATSTVTAYVSFPPKPVPPASAKTADGEASSQDSEDDNEATQSPSTSTSKAKKEKPTVELLDPRIVELIVN